MLKVTRWSPDTCGCILEYSWDDTTTEDERIHTPTNIIKKCEAHQMIPDTATVYDIVMEENPRKNRALNEILQNAPNNNWYDIDAESGQRIFKKNVTTNWSWSGTAPNRVLTLRLNNNSTAVTQQQINLLQTRLNNRFGTGKIILKA